MSCVLCKNAEVKSVTKDGKKSAVCPICGEKIRRDDVFCPECGADQR